MPELVKGSRSNGQQLAMEKAIESNSNDTAACSDGQPAKIRGLVERLEAGEYILCAEGYLLALSRRGYIAYGVFVPDFLLDNPEVLRPIHYEFIHAGTDVTVAFQYNTYRKKLEEVGKIEDVEKINRIALKIAREVALDTGTLMAGGICSTKIYVPDNKQIEAQIREMYTEQVQWAKEEGADYIIAETLYSYGEAEIALEVILSSGLPAVMSMVVLGSSDFKTIDDIPIGEACKRLLDRGATLVGANCFRGPATMMKVVQDIVQVVPPHKVCVLPVLYRTSEEQPTFQDLVDKECAINNPVYPHGLDAFHVSTREVIHFTEQCKELGLKYIGLCCGNTGNYTRAMAMALGKTPPGSKYMKLDVKIISGQERKELLKKGQYPNQEQ